MSKLKVDELRSADRSVSDSANITLADNGSITIPNGTLSAGTIADAVTQPNTLYIQGKNATNWEGMAGSAMFNLNGTTAPYMTFSGDANSFGNGSGNVTGTTTKDLKILTKGIYFISFSLTGYHDGSYASRAFMVRIRGNGSASQSSSVLAEARGQVANTDNSASDLGNAVANYVGLFNVNDQINFYVEALTRNDMSILDTTHFSLFLIKAIA